MSASLTALVALDTAVEPAAVDEALSADAGVEVVGFVHGLEEENNPLVDTPSDVLVLACAEQSDTALSFIRLAVKRHPQRPVVVLCDAASNGFVGRVFEAGADDLMQFAALADPDAAAGLSEQVAFFLRKVVARKTGTSVASATSSGRMICVLGPKGGIGKTLTAANLAVTLAGAGHSVAVVDLDLQFGDVGLALGLSPDRTIFDLARSSGSLDAEKLGAYMAVHESGACVLLAPTRPDQASSITGEFLDGVYALLRSFVDYVIVDTPPGFSPEVITSIDSSSDVCMVGMLDSLSLKNTKLGLETLELMGYDNERVRLVLNRADSRVGITSDDVTEVVGRTPDVLVPSHRDVTRSVNQGVPIALAQPRSEAARAFKQLAAMYDGAAVAGGANGRSRRNRRKKG
jgi:pilus assembly protein CpaE